jgi:predicted ATPase
MALVRKNNYEKAFEKLNKEFTPDNLKNTYKYLPTSVKQEFFRKIDEKRPDLYKMLKAGRSPEIDIAYIPLSDLTDVATEYVQLFFSNQVKYLGPLRDEPKSVYPLAGSIDPKDIGFKGENTAAVLEVHRNTQINYLPCSVFTNNNLSFKMDNKSLIEAVLDWLKYLGIAHDIHTKDRGKLGHELTVSTLGTEDLHDLTHVGVGVSQVLPILVQSLLSEPGSTLIFEQPELHLHPRVQTRLADFFVSMIMIGKQCIIETHSEYMINRLRYMAAVTNGENVSTDVILYFVEKEKGHSIYRPIRINKYGVIKDWPKGFFDENEENAAEILKAGIQKKQKEKNIGK